MRGTLGIWIMLGNVSRKNKDCFVYLFFSMYQLTQPHGFLFHSMQRNLSLMRLKRHHQS